MVPTINEEFTLRIWNSMLIKLRLQCIGNVCYVLVYSQSVYSTQLCVHTEQWIQQWLHGNGAMNGNVHSLRSRSLLWLLE